MTSNTVKSLAELLCEAEDVEGLYELLLMALDSMPPEVRAVFLDKVRAVHKVEV